MTKKNAQQVQAFNAKARHSMMVCGRRGGKTHVIKNKIGKVIRSSPRGSFFLYMAPTNPQAKKIMWRAIQDCFDGWGWIYDPNISEQAIYLTGGRVLYIAGAEVYDRFRGLSFHHIFFDEFYFYKKPLVDIWDKALRACLSDTKGGSTWASTPDGKGSDGYKLFMRAKISDSWEVFQWKTIDNPYIDPEEVEEARRTLDAKSFQQEYEADHISFEGAVYHEFEEEKHVKEQAPINHRIPVHMCLDFNVNPTTLILGQMYGGKMRYKKEYSLSNSSTKETVLRFCEDHKNMARLLDIRIRGDAAGNNRSSNTGYSDYYYLEEALRHYGFRYNMEVPRANPAIVDRIKYMNSWLQPLSGPPKIEIDPSCKELINDLACQELKSGSRQPDDKGGKLGHKADAVGYDIYFSQVEGDKVPSTILM